MTSRAQSTNHLLMIEPAEFYANPETMETNVYQAPADAPRDEIFARALAEFRAFRDALVENGVSVTTAKGLTGAPDMVFPNGFFTFPDGRLILCPMMSENRRLERSDTVVGLLKKMYPHMLDWTGHEAENRALESTASIVSDHVNKICYSALSARTDRDLAMKWADLTGYGIEIFETRSHTGKPVYHTDCLLWIGNTLAGVCSEAIIEQDRARVVESLQKTHEILEISSVQLQNFCGNALQVFGQRGEPMLALSTGAYNAFTADQRAVLSKHFVKLIHAPLPTLEKYGGGSARCTLAELF